MTDEHRPEQSGPEQNNKDRSGRSWLRPVLLVNALLAALLVVLFALFLRDTAPPPPANSVQTSVNATGFVYEEYLGHGLEERVKQTDYALLEALRDQEVDTGGLALLSVSDREHEGQGYHFQELRIPLNHDLEAFLAALNQRLAERSPTTTLRPDGINEYLVSIDGADTHRLLFVPPSVPPPPPPEGEGRLAIVIDDLGENMSLARGLARLPVPVCFAIWPRASLTGEVAALARQKGLEILVHMPMEPRGYPDDDPGPEALFTGMAPEEIKALVKANLARVPGAVGVNNHMGSAFTADLAAMTAALEPLAVRGLFFLDSRTTGSSAAKDAARASGVAFHSRDVFIDNVADVEAVLLQLRKAERLALTRGFAIAIGHPHDETLRALQRWSASKSANLTVVPVSQLPFE